MRVLNPVLLVTCLMGCAPPALPIQPEVLQVKGLIAVAVVPDATTDAELAEMLWALKEGAPLEASQQERPGVIYVFRERDRDSATQWIGRLGEVLRPRSDFEAVAAFYLESDLRYIDSGPAIRDYLGTIGDPAAENHRVVFKEGEVAEYRYQSRRERF